MKPAFTTPGRCKTVDDFRAMLKRLDPEFDCVDQPTGAAGPLGRPFEFKGRTIGNRFAVHPMEGWDGTADGQASHHTLRRWRNFGRSTAKLIWGGEAFAVQEDGRANPRQLFLNPAVDVATSLATLRQQILEGHREAQADTSDLYIGLQLTHSGRYSRPEGKARPRVASPNPVLDPRMGIELAHDLITDLELEGIGENFVRAARLAQETGFDFVDIKCCHGYLLHELLGARLREGPYGGSIDNRTRFLRRLIAEVRSACPDLEIAVRLSVGDVFPHRADERTGVGRPVGWEEHVPYRCGFGVSAEDPRSFDLHEPLAVLQALKKLDIRLVNLTLGSPYTCPHLQRPARYPPSDGYLPPEDPLASVLQHLLAVRVLKKNVPELVVVGTGYSYLQEYLPHVAEYEVGQGHVDFVGLGRMVLVYPELPHDVLAGRPLDKRRICRTFSDCTTAPRNGMVSGCYPLDTHYRQLPEAARLRAIRGRRNGTGTGPDAR